jgi:hypothetical protein
MRNNNSQNVLHFDFKFSSDRRSKWVGFLNCVVASFQSFGHFSQTLIPQNRALRCRWASFLFLHQLERLQECDRSFDPELPLKGLIVLHQLLGAIAVPEIARLRLTETL